jgi:septum formation protein
VNRLILASGSPRRRQLLDMLGLSFDVVPADVDETRFEGESPRSHAERLAREKAGAVAARFPGSVVVGSDTIVVLEDEILGKPRDEQEAEAMLLRLNGRTHMVMTGVAVARDGKVRSAVETASVRFRPFDEEFARAYIATGEPADKAGAYGIQGYGSAIVERVEGDYYAVMGLPIVRLLALLEAAGMRYLFGAHTVAAEPRFGSGEVRR